MVMFDTEGRDYFNDDDFVLGGHTSMWCAVLHQALLDGLNGEHRLPVSPMDRRVNDAERVALAYLLIEQDRNYFSLDDDQFLLVCHNAGLDPKAVAERAWRMFDARPIEDALRDIMRINRKSPIIKDVPYRHRVEPLRREISRRRLVSEALINHPERALEVRNIRRRHSLAWQCALYAAEHASP
jgi:hypothetical protein